MIFPLHKSDEICALNRWLTHVLLLILSGVTDFAIIAVLQQPYPSLLIFIKYADFNDYRALRGGVGLGRFERCLVDAALLV